MQRNDGIRGDFTHYGKNLPRQAVGMVEWHPQARLAACGEVPSQ
jgi:hypothetical protein